MITLVNYGLGNIQAFLNIYHRLNIPCCSATSIAELRKASHLILPGVGSFDWAMKSLNASGMRDAIEVLVHENQIPFLGVCVGMQMLAEGSEEGSEAGLGWIKGHVKKFDESVIGSGSPLPHMGWNQVTSVRDNSLLAGREEQWRFYFLHLFYFSTEDKANVLATTDYGNEFASVVQAGNISGTQFHPEKSHQWGIQLLKNFAEN